MLGARIVRGISTIVAVAENAWSMSHDPVDGSAQGDWHGCDDEDVRAGFRFLSALCNWFDFQERVRHDDSGPDGCHVGDDVNEGRR